MAGLDALLQRIARSLEEAGAQQPGDDLRARLGYGTGDEEEESASDSVWEPETGREPETAREPQPAHTPPRAWKPKTVWSPETPGSAALPSATRRAAEAYGVPAAGRSPGGATGSRTTQPYAHSSTTHALSAHLRARLGTPDALREAFVVKEILDRPLARRRGR